MTRTRNRKIIKYLKQMSEETRKDMMGSHPAAYVQGCELKMNLLAVLISFLKTHPSASFEAMNQVMAWMAANVTHACMIDDDPKECGNKLIDIISAFQEPLNRSSQITLQVTYDDQTVVNVPHLFEGSEKPPLN